MAEHIEQLRQQMADDLGLLSDDEIDTLAGLADDAHGGALDDAMLEMGTLVLKLFRENRRLRHELGGCIEYVFQFAGRG